MPIHIYRNSASAIFTKTIQFNLFLVESVHKGEVSIAILKGVIGKQQFLAVFSQIHYIMIVILPIWEIHLFFTQMWSLVSRGAIYKYIYNFKFWFSAQSIFSFEMGCFSV